MFSTGWLNDDGSLIPRTLKNRCFRSVSFYVSNGSFKIRGMGHRHLGNYTVVKQGWYQEGTDRDWHEWLNFKQMMDELWPIIIAAVIYLGL